MRLPISFYLSNIPVHPRSSTQHPSLSIHPSKQQQPTHNLTIPLKTSKDNALMSRACPFSLAGPCLASGKSKTRASSTSLILLSNPVGNIAAGSKNYFGGSKVKFPNEKLSIVFIGTVINVHKRTIHARFCGTWEIMGASYRNVRI